MTSRSRDPAAAPRFLDPVLALVERLDRWRRRIRPARPGSLLGVEPRRHRGGELRLSDGVVVRPGARLWVVHFDNARLRELGTESWQSRAYAVARGDLATLAAQVTALPQARRPVALSGVTLLTALAERVGFEVRERRSTAWVRVEDWYLRSLLARWAPAGRRRLERGHGPLVSREGWMSTTALLRRYGPGAGPSPDRSSERALPPGDDASAPGGPPP